MFVIAGEKGSPLVARHYSPYSSHQRRRARWPWVLLVIVFGFAAMLGGAIVSGRQSPSDLYDRAHDRIASLTKDDTPSGEPTQPAAASNLTPGAQSVAQVTDGSAIASPQAAGSVDQSNPVAVARQYAALWSAGDYDGLYDLLSASVQATVPRQDFIDRYKGIANEAGLISVKASAGDQMSLAGEVPLSVTLESQWVGTIQQTDTLPLVNDADGWRIAWTPSLIFNNLGNNCIEYKPDATERGSILDRNQQPLAYDGKVSQVGVIPGQINDEGKLLDTLSSLLSISADEIQAKYADKPADWFIPIKDFPEEMDSKTLSSLQGIGGIVVRSSVSRVYPLGKAAAHITGYVTPATADDIAADKQHNVQPDSMVGRAGVEAAANDILAGKPGGVLRIVDCTARVEKEVIAQRDSVPGENVILTVDIDLQKSVDKALDVDKGSAVVLDPRNGEVLALVSHPTYDPNWFVLGFNDADWAYINDDTQRPLFNRAAEATYPTGSIFKVITMSAGMADLGMTGDTQFDCPATWSIPGTDSVFRDWTVDEGVGAQGQMTLHNALVTSCNTIFYQVGYALDQKDNELLPEMAKAYGLGSPTGIPYYYEASGTVPTPEWKQETVGDFWATGDSINLSIGQGYLLATPLQMAVAYAAIANGGHVLQPYMVEYTQKASTGKRTRVGKRVERSTLPLSSDQVKEIQSAMRDQTSNTFGAGSVKVFGTYDYPIAGKTGTAQNDLDQNATPHSWFASFGPYGQTATITTIVMAENKGEGVTYAAPFTKAIYDAYRKTNLADG
jgi:penicillin-binding protein 2